MSEKSFYYVSKCTSNNRHTTEAEAVEAAKKQIKYALQKGYTTTELYVAKVTKFVGQSTPPIEVTDLSDEVQS